MKPVKRKHRFLFWLRKRRGDPLNETRFTERAQTALRLADVVVTEAGFGAVTVTGDLTSRPPAAEEDRWIFRCQKPVRPR